MSLLRLLTAGKSLVNGAKGSGHYQVPHGRVLPRFAAKKNPFRTTTLPEATRPSPEVVEPPQAVAPEKPLEPAPVLVAAPAPIAVTESVLPARPSVLQRLKAAVLRLVPARQPVAFAAPRPTMTRRLVQTELLLEKVIVVRNDLSDSDLEVVPSGRIESAAKSAAADRSAAVRDRLSRVGSRFFGNTQQPVERR